MTRAAIFATLVFLSGALASSGVACESRHVDQYLGTDAGADFDAPARPAPTDATDDDGGASPSADGGMAESPL